MNFWRNPQPEVSIDDDTAWPKLSSAGPTRSLRVNCQQSTSCASTDNVQVKVEVPSTSSAITVTSNFRKANNDEENLLRTVGQHKINLVRKSRRLDKICINLQEALANAACSKKCQSKGTLNTGPDISRLRATQNKIHNDHSQTGTRKTKTYIVKVRRPSKLKKVILLARNNRKLEKSLTYCESCKEENSQTSDPDVCSLDLSSLKIKADPEIDVDYVKHLSTLSIYGKEHRTPTVERINENSVQFRPSLTNKLGNLSINNVDDDLSTEFPETHGDILDSDILEKTLSLEINDDTKQYFHDIKPSVQPTIQFTRNFREYCTNVLSPALRVTLEKLLSELQRLQRRLYERDCIKGKYRRRYYSGLKETLKHVELKKVKFVVIAPDLEKVELPGGLDEQVCKLVEACRKYAVPVCFGLRRRKLGYYTHGNGNIGCVGIANYSGLEEIFRDVLVELLRARNDFKKLNGEPEKIIQLDKLMGDENLLLSESIAILMRTLASGN